MFRGSVRSVMPVRLFLVDDQQMFSEALAARLSRSPELWVLGNAPTADPSLLELLARLRPNVITVDVEPFRAATSAVLELLRASCPVANLVVVTGTEDPTLAVDAARAGAVGWVSKTSPPEHLVDVLLAASQGHAWYPPSQLGAVLRELRGDLRPLDVLSARELEVLRGVVDGLRGGDIATELGMSPNTVRTHTNSIFSKLGVHSRLEAVSVARAAGLRPRPQGADGGMAIRPIRTT